MKRLLIVLILALAPSLVLVGCTQAQPTAAPTAAPAPTKAAAAPTAAPAPTKAAAAPTAPPAPTKAAAAPTAAPAKKIDWPEKGKTITMILPFAAGGDVDVQARVLAPFLEKELGTNIELIAVSAAGGQQAWTQLAQAKPDGYTLGYIGIPNIVTQILEPARKTVFDRKSFTMLGLHSWEPGVVAVLPSSPYKTMKDLVDAARAAPEKIIAGDASILNAGQLAILQLQDSEKIKFANPHLGGGAPLVTALLGGHIDAAFTFVPIVTPHVRNGALHALAVVDSQPSDYLPGVPTMAQAGFKSAAFSSSIRPIAAPAGLPQDIRDVLMGALNRAMENPEQKSKMKELGYSQRVMTPEQIDALMAQMEIDLKPYMALAQQ